MKITNELRIGVLIVAVLGILAYLTLKAGDFKISKEGYPIKVMFKNIDGVSLNAPVMLEGYEVGSVKDIKISYDNEDTLMELTLWLDLNAKLRDGAKAYVKNMGFMGEKYVGLTSGDKGKDYLMADSIIAGGEPADLDKLLRDGQAIADNIKSISENVNQRLKVNEEHIDRIMMNLDTTVENLASITDNIDERLKVNEEKIDNIVSNFEASSENLEGMTGDLKNNPWKLLYRPKSDKK